MTHGSLFSGIGGFDLAAQWMGWENVFHCEWNPICQRVLKYHFPKSICYEDITKTDFTVHRGRIDLITGGFPCQPYSMAGKRLGKDDERHLFPEMLRAIREIQPRWVVGENVFGLVNWNGGLVFEEVQADLEAEGYEVQPFILPACGVQNAPHRRDRVWFVANSNNGGHSSGRREAKEKNGVQGIGGQTMETGKSYGANISSITSDTNDTSTKHSIQTRRNLPTSKNKYGLTSDTRSNRDKRNLGAARKESEKPECEKQRGEFVGNCSERSAADTGLQRQAFSKNQTTGVEQCGFWDSFPTQSPICSRDDEFSDRLVGITFSKWRNESIKGYGNAVVPALVLQIFKAIQQYEEMINNQ